MPRAQYLNEIENKAPSHIRLKKNATVEEFSPTTELADVNFIGRVIAECLENDDPEGAMEALEAHLAARIHLANSPL